MTQIWKVTVAWQFNSSIDMENVHHFSISPDPDSAALTNLCLQMCTDWETYLEANATDMLEYRGNWLRRVDIANQPTYWFPFQGANDGFGDSVVSPLNPREAMVVNWTAFSDFPRLCRTYIPGWTEYHNDDPGQPTTNAISEAEAYAGSIRLQTLTGGYTATKCAVRYTGTPPYVNQSNIVTAYAASTKFGNLRSRKT